MANSMSLKILAEMQSGKVVQGLTEIQQGLKGVQSAAERSSAALDTLETQQRQLRALGKAAQEAALMVRAKAEAARQASAADAAAIRQAMAATRAARESLAVLRETVDTYSKEGQAALTAARQAVRAAQTKTASLRDVAAAQRQASANEIAAARGSVAAIRSAERAKRQEIAETTKAVRGSAEAQQAAMTLRNTALGVAAGAGAMGATGGALIKQAVEASAAYEEQTNELEVFFGKNAKDADAWSRNLGKSLGKGEASVRSLALSLQKNLAPILGSDKAYEYTKKLTQRAIDLGSLSDTDPETVAKNIISGLQGLPTPMRKYGATPLVGYLQQFQDQRAAAAGQQSKKWKDMNYEERTTLRADYITEKTQHAEGDAERTADSTANTMLRFRKTIDNVFLDMGQSLKDSLRPLIGALADMAQWFDDMNPATKRFVADLLIVGTGLTTFAGVVGGAAAAWWGYEAAAAAAKVMTGKAGVAAGEAALGGLAKFRLAFVTAAPEIAAVVLLVVALMMVFGVLFDLTDDLEGSLSGVWDAIKAIVLAIGLMLSSITDPMTALEDILINIIKLAAKVIRALPGGDGALADGLDSAAASIQERHNKLAQEQAATGTMSVYQKIKDMANPIAADGEGTSFAEIMKTSLTSAARGWGKALAMVYSNDPLKAGARNNANGVQADLPENGDADAMPEGDSFAKALGQKNRIKAAQEAAAGRQQRQREAYEAAALPMYMTSDYQSRRQEQDQWRVDATVGQGGLKLDSDLLVESLGTVVKGAKQGWEDADKAAQEAARAAEKAAIEEEKAAASAQRHAEKMNRIYSDIISNVLGRFEAFAAGDMKGAFGKLGASLGGLIEQAGVPFAGAIGSALDAVVQALAGPLEKLGGKLFGGAEISDAVDSLTKVMVAASVSVGVFNVFLTQFGAILGAIGFALLGPLFPLAYAFAALTAILGGWLVLLVLLSTQTQEFANFSSMLNEAVKRLIAPMGSFWESLYPLGGALMQIGTILGPVGAAFLGLLNAPSFIQPLIDVAVFAAKALLVFSYLMYGTAAAWQVVRTTASSLATVFDRVGRWFEQVWLGMIQPFQWLGAVISMAVQGLMDWFMALSWVQAVMNFFAEAWAGMTGILMSGVSAFGKAMIGMINWVEDFTGLDILGEKSLGNLVESIDKAWKDLDKVSAESGKKEADKFLEDQNAAAAGSTEQNINLPEAFKLAAARATFTDANGNGSGSGSWGSGAGSGAGSSGMARGDMPIDRFNPTVNITVLVNGVTQESAMEYADKSRGFRQLIESGIVMMRQEPNLDPGKGRRNRN